MYLKTVKSGIMRDQGGGVLDRTIQKLSRGLAGP